MNARLLTDDFENALDETADLAWVYLSKACFVGIWMTSLQSQIADSRVDQWEVVGTHIRWGPLEHLRLSIEANISS